MRPEPLKIPIQLLRGADSLSLSLKGGRYTPIWAILQFLSLAISLANHSSPLPMPCAMVNQIVMARTSTSWGFIYFFSWGLIRNELYHVMCVVPPQGENLCTTWWGPCTAWQFMLLCTYFLHFFWLNSKFAPHGGKKIMLSLGLGFWPFFSYFGPNSPPFTSL